jgi:hypothetical protein
MQSHSLAENATAGQECPAYRAFEIFNALFAKPLRGPTPATGEKSWGLDSKRLDKELTIQLNGEGLSL